VRRRAGRRDGDLDASGFFSTDCGAAVASKSAKGDFEGDSIGDGYWVRELA